MKVQINGKEYGFIWGMRCFMDAQNHIGLVPDYFLQHLTDPTVSTSIIYHGLKLWCSVNKEDCPFEDFEDFIMRYDTIGDTGFYKHIITDILESMYLGETLVNYLERSYSVDIKDFESASKAKKKYLLTLESIISTSQVGDLDATKSKPSRSKSTKSTDTATK